MLISRTCLMSSLVLALSVTNHCLVPPASGDAADTDSASGADSDEPDDPDRWVQSAGPEGGTITHVEMDPNDPDRLLVAAWLGGRVFDSTDGGESFWEKPMFADPNLFITDLIMDPANAETYFAVVGNEVFRTEDRGDAWTELAIPFPDTDAVLQCFAIAATDAQRMIAGSLSGPALSSQDGGQTWTDHSPTFVGQSVRGVAAGEVDEYWVATAAPGTGGLFHTTNNGSTWTEVHLPAPKPTDSTYRNVHVDPRDRTRVYVTIRDVSNLCEVGNAPGLYRSENAGASFSPLTLPDSQCNPRVIQQDTAHNTLWVAAGVPIFSSTNYGNSWTKLNMPTATSAVDPVDIAVDPGNAKIIYLPDRASSLVKTTTGGKSWIQQTSGIIATEPFLLAAAGPVGSEVVYTAGLGLHRSPDRGQTWERIDRPFIDHPYPDELVVSPHDPKVLWYVADVGTIYETRDGGDSWSTIVDPRPSKSGFRASSVYALAPAPSDKNIIYALNNGFGIFRSADAGAHWSFLRHSEVDYTYDIAIHPTDSDILYAGTLPKPFEDFAKVRQSVDGGEAWDSVLEVSNSRGITSVAIDPAVPTTAYAAGTEGRRGTIWRSQGNSGAWSPLAPSLTFTNIHTMALNPLDPNAALAGVWGGGTFMTVDRGITWAEIPNAPTPSASAILVGASAGAGGLPPVYMADRHSPRIYRVDPAGKQWSWTTYYDPGEGYYRVMTAALAPSDSDLVYASIFRAGEGPMAGRVFRISDDGGDDVTNGLPRLPVALTVDPDEANTVYAVLHGNGVFRTSDGGDTWSDISGPGSGLPQTPKVGFVGLVVDPATTPEALYLFGGCDVGLDLSHSGAAATDMNTIYISTNGGTTWTNLDDGNLGEKSGAIKGVAISPLDSDVIFAGASLGVFRSTDGGSNWTDISGGLGFSQTAGVMLSSDGKQIYAPTLGGGMYVGDVTPATHAVTWRSTSTLEAEIHNVQIEVSPSDSKTLYASAYPGGLFKSSDAGQTWAEMNFGLPSFAIDDPTRQGYYAFSIAPSAPETIFLGLYGRGVYKSTDGAGTWRPVPGVGRTLAGAKVTSLVVDPADADTAWVGAEDGLYATTNGGTTWNAVDTGSSFDVRTLALKADGGLLVGTRGYGVYHAAGDNPAAPWIQTNAFGGYGGTWPIWNDRPLYQYTTVLFHPTDPKIIYIGTFPAGIFKSVDAGATWRESNVGWTNDGVFSLVTYPDDPDQIFAGTYNGLNRSLDGGQNWEPWDQGWPDEQWVFSIAFDPTDASTMYACSKNGENEGTGTHGFHGTVAKSIDGGEHWVEIANGLDRDQEFYVIIADPFRPGTLYLASQRTGVLRSTDRGGQWDAWNDGLTNPFAAANGNNVSDVMTISTDAKWLYFGTVGSGVFRRRLDLQ